MPNPRPDSTPPVYVHDGACGPRVACPEHGWPWGALYRPAELVNGLVVAHDCGGRWLPREALALLRSEWHARAELRDQLVGELEAIFAEIDGIYSATVQQ
jgi:hypothetical protein